MRPVSDDICLAIRDMTTPQPHQANPPEPADAPRPTPDPGVATVQRDRYCVRCGANLRGCAVRHHNETALRYIACPECGHHTAADSRAGRTSVFQQHLMMLTVGVWVVALPLIVLAALIAQVVITIVAFEDATRSSGRLITFELGRRHAMRNLLLAGAGSFALHFGWSALLAIACHHWRGPVALGVVRFVSMATHLTAGVVLQFTIANYAFGGALGMFVAAGSALAVVAVSLGYPLGRPLARVAVRILVPHEFRSYAAWLWRADSLIPPHEQPPA